MGRKPKSESNRLELETLGSGLYRLSGYIHGERIRKQSTDLAYLEGLKTSFEHGALKAEIAQNDRHILPATWITPAQLRDAEAAFLALGDSKLTLVQCVEVGMKHLGDGEPVKWATALQDYIAYQEEKALAKRTREASRITLIAFAAFAKPETLSEIDSRMVERFSTQSKYKPGSQVQIASVMRAFFNFCLSRKFLRVSPFEIDTKALSKRAKRTQSRARILTPEQCEALLKAALDTDGGSQVPFVILSLWCFIRRQEVMRLTSADIIFGEKQTLIDIQPSVAKTASYRRIAVPANVAPLLKACKDRGLIDAEPLYQSPETWREIREKAGLLTRAKNSIGQKRIVTDSQWQENILRHTGLSCRFQSTGDIIETAREAGNSPDVAFERYVNLGQPEAAAKFYAITGTLPALDQGEAPVSFQASA